MNVKIVLLTGAALALSLGGCASMGRSGSTVSAACSDITFPIYFQEGSNALTAPAVEAIAMSAQRAKACRVLGVEVTGLSDGPTATPQSLALSSRRAETVSGVLTSNGLPTPSISLVASRGGARTSRNTRATALRQPTEVVIRVAR